MRIDGDAHDAPVLEVESDVDALPIEAIKLGDGVAGGREEAEGNMVVLLTVNMQAAYPESLWSGDRSLREALFHC
jgi:hypothetical protein